MRTVLLALLVLLLAPHEVHADDQLVFHGTPAAKTESSLTATGTIELSDSKKQENRLLIVKRDGKYLWASRDGRELFYRHSGIFHVFIDPMGAGYIKIADPSALLGSSESTIFPYYEHMSLGLETLTYWGTATSFSP